MMFNNLPSAIQTKIRCLLEHNDFVAAKALYDCWRPKK